MRTISTDNEKLLTAEGGSTAFVRVFVKDNGGTFRDLTTYPEQNMVLGASWRESVDDPGYTAEVRLRRQVESLSLAPLQESSPLNKGFNPAASYAALIDIGREVKVEWSLVPLEGSPATWSKGFHGYIDIVKFADEEMVLFCSDQISKLRDTWIERERIYSFAQGANATKGCFVFEPSTAYSVGDLVVPTQAKINDHFYKCTTAGTTASTEPTWATGAGSTTSSGSAVFTEQGATSTSTGTPVQDIIQQILNDNLSTAPTLYVPTSPGWNIRWYLQKRTSVMDAVFALAEQIGWDIRWKWDNGTSDFRLTLWSPDRSKTSADRTWGSFDQPVAIEQLDLDLKDIRNVVRIRFSDSQALDTNGTPTRKMYEATNGTSITNYGRRFCELEEDSNSNIDSSTEAQTLADNILSDLALPVATHSARLALFPFAEIGDLYQYAANDQHYSTAQKFAVTSIQHELKNEGPASTILTGRGKVSGGYAKWLRKEGRVNQKGVHQQVQLNSPGILLAATPIVGGAVLATTLSEGKHSKRTRQEFHVSTSSGFTPSSGTLKSEGVQRQVALGELVPGKTYYGKTVPITFNDGRIVRGLPSEQVQFIAGRGNAGHLYDRVNWGNLPLNGGFETITEAGAVPDHWEVDSANGTTWGTHAVLLQDGSGTSGQSYVKLVTNNTTTVARIYSAKFVVNERMEFLAEVFAKMVAGSGNNFSVELLITDKDDSFVATYTDSFSLAADVGVWKPYRLVPRAPVANAAFGRMALTVELGASGREVHIDSARFWQEEAWHEVGGSGEPAFANSWVNYDGTTYQTAAFRRDQRGRVHIKGLVKSGTVGAGTPVFTLPAGYRPPLTIHFATISNAAFGSLVVRSSGDVDIVTGNNTYASIECSFDPW